MLVNGLLDKEMRLKQISKKLKEEGSLRCHWHRYLLLLFLTVSTYVVVTALLQKKSNLDYTLVIASRRVAGPISSALRLGNTIPKKCRRVGDPLATLHAI